ncbi:MAG: PHA/PHB synthase family protein [Telluria sp.]
MANTTVARRPRAPTLQQSADALGASNDGARTPGGSLADVWKSLAGLKLPAEALAEAQRDYVVDATAIWNRLLMPGSARPAIDDRRFASPEWTASPPASFLAEMYLLNARTLLRLAKSVEADPKTQARIRFAVLQWIDAASPSNYLALNPEAQKKAIESRGESLLHGLGNLWDDAQRGHLSQTDESAFEVGRNVATTAGSVVFENELFQLIEYAPITAKVHERPILFVPPCINKFYILDLQPENSVVRYAVEQGNTVMLVSWRNPDKSLGNTTWDDYVETGAIKAIEVTRAITGQDKVNAFGFCVGGTIVATALAVLAARGDQAASSVTLLTTLLDFSDTGVLEVFVDQNQVAMREQQLGKGGLMPGRDLATTFSALRPNDLVWNYVQSNYLKGNEPPAFDLLYWNADSTNLPGPMFCWYLRNMYLENNLREAGKLTVAGHPVHLGDIDAPAFLFGSKEDHIVPWTAAFSSMSLVNPKKPKNNKFVLGASGHIAGVINPASKGKRSYWVNEASGKAKPKTADAWFEGATEHKGSWWGEWAKFLADNGGKDIAAPKKPGNAAFAPIEPAPGRYVKVRAD